MSDKAIHVFNERGEPVLAVRTLERRIRELEAENVKLKQVIVRQARAAQPRGDLLPEPIKQ